MTDPSVAEIVIEQGEALVRVVEMGFVFFGGEADCRTFH
jgi:hypothetical protein